MSLRLTEASIRHFFATSLDMLDVLIERTVDKARVLLVVEPRFEEAHEKLLERLRERSVSEAVFHSLSELMESKPEGLTELLERWSRPSLPEEPPSDQPYTPAQKEGEP